MTAGGQSCWATLDMRPPAVSVVSLFVFAPSGSNRAHQIVAFSFELYTGQLILAVFCPLLTF